MPDIDLKKNSILKQALMKALEGGQLAAGGEVPSEEVAPVEAAPEEERDYFPPEDIMTPEGLAELIKRLSE